MTSENCEERLEDQIKKLTVAVKNGNEIQEHILKEKSLIMKEQSLIKSKLDLVMQEMFQDIKDTSDLTAISALLLEKKKPPSHKNEFD